MIVYYLESNCMPLLHLHREIKSLNKLLLQLGGQVEENLRQGIQFIQTRNTRQALDVKDEDQLVDSLEVQVEEECLKLLALYQPVASDLRYIVAVLKINGDLERIGDLAANLGRQSSKLAKKEQVAIPDQLNLMASIAREMLHQSLDALVARDINSCRRILHRDKQVDTLYGEVYDWFRLRVKEEPDHAGLLLGMYLAAKDLERIADHTCNIAEDVIYLISGEIVRHHHLEEDD